MNSARAISLWVAPLLAGAVFSALAAPPSPYAGASKPGAMQGVPNPGVFVSPCPSGWNKVATLANGGFKCQPKKPAPLNCPPGTYYYQQTCEVGCAPEIK